MNNLRNFRLTNQQLSATKWQTPRELLWWMGAMQAQDYNMAKWAVGIRLAGYNEQAVEEAFNRGEILRTHVLRPTWHFVAPGAIRWMLALSAARIKATTAHRDRDLEITETLYGKVNRLIEKALADNRHLTRQEIAKMLVRAGVAVDVARMVHFMMRAEVEGIVCSGALQGKTHTYALLEERVPPVAPLHRQEALAMLAKVYFTSHGQATLADFVWWSGLLQSEARSGLEAAKDSLASETIGNQTYWQSTESTSVAQPTEAAYLLPAFDEYLISYRDRSAVIDDAQRSKVISSNGVFRPTIVAGGQVVGLWQKPTAKGNPPLLDFFAPPSALTATKVNKAVAALKEFL